MIATIDVEMQAANPTMPLYPWRAFKGSSTSLRIRNIPKKIGTWQITSVDVQVEYPDNQILINTAKLVGGVWITTLDGSSLSGLTKNGYSIIASGIDEDGNVVTNYILGKGDVEILDSDSIIEAGIDVSAVKLYASKPSDIKNGDTWIEGTTLVLFYDNQEFRYGECFNPTTQQLNAINSGINSTKVANYDNAYAKIPNQVWNDNNMLADKAFVNSSVQTATANFRGNWKTVEDVPTDANQYPEDYTGSKTPTTNDYLVVENLMVDTRTEIRLASNDELLAYIDSYDEDTMTFYIEWADGSKSSGTADSWDDNHEVFISKYPYTLVMTAYGENITIDSWNYGCENDEIGNSEGITVTKGQKGSIGTWRFKYVGSWNVDGKNGWKQEYQVNETPMTAEQLAVLDSGITKQKVDSMLTSANLSAAMSNVLPRYEFKTITAHDTNLIELESYKSLYWLCNHEELSIMVDSNSTNKLREMILVIDTRNTVPSYMFWGSNFHPRTDANTDFKCEDGINVFWISEYMQDQFVVSRWLQTVGGNE